MIRTGGRASEELRTEVEDLAFRGGRYLGSEEAMSQLGFRGN